MTEAIIRAALAFLTETGWPVRQAAAPTPGLRPPYVLFTCEAQADGAFTCTAECWTAAGIAEALHAAAALFPQMTERTLRTPDGLFLFIPAAVTAAQDKKDPALHCARVRMRGVGAAKGCGQYHADAVFYSFN